MSFIHFSEFIASKKEEELDWAVAYGESEPPFAMLVDEHGIHVWSDGDGDFEACCDFMQAFLRKWAPDKYLTISCAIVGDSSDVGASYGVARLIGAEVIESFDCRRLAEESLKGK